MLLPEVQLHQISTPGRPGYKQHFVILNKNHFQEDKKKKWVAAVVPRGVHAWSAGFSDTEALLKTLSNALC